MTPTKGYTEMKDSGIEWVGPIPGHWDILRGKNVLRLLERPVKLDDDVVTCFRDGEVTLRKNRREEGFTNSLKEIGYQGIEPGDLIVHGMDGFAGAIGISDSRGKASPVLNVMDSNQNKRYLMYYLRAMAYKDVFMALSTGIRVRSCDLRWNKLSVFPFLIPTSHEQSAIAAYLDTQCAKIDEIIAQAKASIEDYKQWKSSIIYEAVTKGLDPNVEMKDSGIEWIGRMPAHWTAPALKHLCTMQAGKNLISEQISTSGQYPVYGGNGQRGYYSDYNANGNFLLVGRQGALCGNVHYVSGKFWATEHAVVTTPSKITNIRYLYYLLIAMDLNQYASNSAAQPGLSVGNILTVKTLLPPIGEQVRISEFLDNCCPRIDEVITEKQSLIDDLESYKKSLIYEVVTGKRGVI